MTQDRITSIHIAGFKSIEELLMPLDGLTVLIGENGSGKSSILEALSIFGSAAERLSHVTDVVERSFGRFQQLLHHGSSVLRIEGTIEGEGPGLLYGFSIGSAGTYPVVLDEWLYEDAASSQEDARVVFSRKGRICRFQTQGAEWVEMDVGEQTLGLSYAGAGAASGVLRVLDALGMIEVQPPFDVRPIWQQRELGIAEGPRWPRSIEPAARLQRYGQNISSAYHELKNMGGDVWEQVLALAQLGLGEDLRDIRLPAEGRGNIDLELVFESGLTVTSERLSEGQLSYLCFIALTELGKNRALLAVDEPEVHLHPGLMSRVIWMLEEAAESAPVIVATQSDRLLDALEDPAKSVVLCELDGKRRTILRRVDRESLEKWLANYSGLGTLRVEGHEQRVFLEAESPKSAEKS